MGKGRAYLCGLGPEIKTVSRTEKNPKVLTEFYQHGYDLMEQKLDGLLEYLGN